MLECELIYIISLPCFISITVCIRIFKGKRLLIIATDAINEKRLTQNRTAIEEAIRVGMRHIIFTG